MSNNGRYEGTAELKENVDVIEEDDKLFVRAVAHFNNPEKLSQEEIEDIIRETVMHYYRSGPAATFGKVVYYTGGNDSIDFDDPPVDVSAIEVLEIFDEDEVRDLLEDSGLTYSQKAEIIECYKRTITKSLPEDYKYGQGTIHIWIDELKRHQ